MAILHLLSEPEVNRIVCSFGIQTSRRLIQIYKQISKHKTASRLLEARKLVEKKLEIREASGAMSSWAEEANQQLGWQFCFHCCVFSCCCCWLFSYLVSCLIANTPTNTVAATTQEPICVFAHRKWGCQAKLLFLLSLLLICSAACMLNSQLDIHIRWACSLQSSGKYPEGLQLLMPLLHPLPSLLWPDDSSRSPEFVLLELANLRLSGSRGGGKIFEPRGERIKVKVLPSLLRRLLCFWIVSRPVLFSSRVEKGENSLLELASTGNGSWPHDYNWIATLKPLGLIKGHSLIVCVLPSL